MNQIIKGDSLEVLKQFDDDSIDLIVTDPPYGYSFMGKEWDKALVSIGIWKECIRVLKAGAFAFVMSAPRQDVLSRMIVNLGDAGFRTDFTSMYHTYASGFPKAKNLKDGSYAGFQPKPAVEVILTVMKPLSENSYTEQVLANGKGVTWLDSCRIPHNEPLKITDRNKRISQTWEQGSNFKNENNNIASANSSGRFPANLLVSDDSLNDGYIRKSGSREPHHVFTAPKTSDIYGKFKSNATLCQGDSGSYSRYFSLDSWYDNKRAQFIITPKASPSERNGATHPTIKPIKLMSYLITMGSRENDLVLDPFAGSGTTLIAAYQLHRQFIGIEISDEYVTIANKRLEPYLLQTKLKW